MGKKGQLLFKGDKRPKKKSKKSKAKNDNKKQQARDDDDDDDDDDDGVVVQQQDAPATTVVQKPKAAAAATTTPAAMPAIQSGTGKITTSGTVVTGFGTKFTSQVGVGDAILVGDEMRVITMRLSDTSLNLSSAFSKNSKEPTGFRFVAKPKNQQEAHLAQQKQQQEASAAVQRNAFDIYGKNNKNVFTYREKTETGSYRVKQQATSSTSSSRTDMLTLRSKKTSDKYC